MDRRTRRKLRRGFLRRLFIELQVIWPIWSGMVIVIVGLGLVAGVREGWRVQDSLYFSFVTGLTIGYGDLTPKTLLARTLAICIGAIGIMMTALLAAVAVKALDEAGESES